MYRGMDPLQFIFSLIILVYIIWLIIGCILAMPCCTFVSKVFQAIRLLLIALITSFKSTWPLSNDSSSACARYNSMCKRLRYKLSGQTWTREKEQSETTGNM